ncbi:MAG: hypothetical protein V7L05_01790 [Nostoc sp.]|uniref:hypothetical protein n=1 Tax=Nostoc sp. TaxID=1180 RepID=UPI002FF733E1
MVKLNTMVLRIGMSVSRQVRFQRLESLPAHLFIKLFEHIPWLLQHQPSMGLVKAVLRRHRRNAARSLDIWAEALT